MDAVVDFSFVQSNLFTYRRYLDNFMTEKQSGLVNRDSYRAETVFDTKNIIDYNIAEKIITIKKFQILS